MPGNFWKNPEKTIKKTLAGQTREMKTIKGLLGHDQEHLEAYTVDQSTVEPQAFAANVESSAAVPAIVAELLEDDQVVVKDNVQQLMGALQNSVDNVD